MAEVNSQEGLEELTQKVRQAEEQIRETLKKSFVGIPLTEIAIARMESVVNQVLKDTFRKTARETALFTLRAKVTQNANDPTILECLFYEHRPDDVHPGNLHEKESGGDSGPGPDDHLDGL